MQHENSMSRLLLEGWKLIVLHISDWNTPPTPTVHLIMCRIILLCHKKLAEEQIKQKTSMSVVSMKDQISYSFGTFIRFFN